MSMNVQRSRRCLQLSKLLGWIHPSSLQGPLMGKITLIHASTIILIINMLDKQWYHWWQLTFIFCFRHTYRTGRKFWVLCNLKASPGFFTCKLWSNIDALVKNDQYFKSLTFMLLFWCYFFIVVVNGANIIINKSEIKPTLHQTMWWCVMNVFLLLFLTLPLKSHHVPFWCNLSFLIVNIYFSMLSKHDFEMKGLNTVCKLPQTLF